MCLSSTEVRKLAESHLLDTEHGRKRKLDEVTAEVPRYGICEQCDVEFDATENEEGDCVWHEGKPLIS